MNSSFLIEVETTEVKDLNGNIVAIFKKPSGLLEDRFGKYIINTETGEKVYFEYRNVEDEELPPPPEPDRYNP